MSGGNPELDIHYEDGFLSQIEDIEEGFESKRLRPESYQASIRVTSGSIENLSRKLFDADIELTVYGYTRDPKKFVNEEEANPLTVPRREGETDEELAKRVLGYLAKHGETKESEWTIWPEELTPQWREMGSDWNELIPAKDWLEEHGYNTRYVLEGVAESPELAATLKQLGEQVEIGLIAGSHGHTARMQYRDTGPGTNHFEVEYASDRNGAEVEVWIDDLLDTVEQQYDTQRTL